MPGFLTAKYGKKAKYDRGMVLFVYFAWFAALGRQWIIFDTWIVGAAPWVRDFVANASRAV